MCKLSFLAKRTQNGSHIYCVVLSQPCETKHGTVKRLFALSNKKQDGSGVMKAMQRESRLLFARLRRVLKIWPSLAVCRVCSPTVSDDSSNRSNAVIAPHSRAQWLSRSITLRVRSAATNIKAVTTGSKLQDVMTTRHTALWINVEGDAGWTRRVARVEFTDPANERIRVDYAEFVEHERLDGMFDDDCRMVSWKRGYHYWIRTDQVLRVAILKPLTNGVLDDDTFVALWDPHGPLSSGLFDRIVLGSEPVFEQAASIDDNVLFGNENREEQPPAQANQDDRAPVADARDENAEEDSDSDEMDKEDNDNSSGSWRRVCVPLLRAE